MRIKNNIHILLLLFVPLLGCSQRNKEQQVERDDNSISLDIVIGEYGISTKDEAIGEYRVFGCGPASECYGYFDDGRISYHNTKLYFINGTPKFSGDISIDVPTIKIIDRGYNSYPNFKRSTPIFIDKNNAFSGAHINRAIGSLNGFEFFKGNFLVKDDTLAYLDERGMYIITNSQSIDKVTFTPIAQHFFYDKNGVYHLENGYSEIEGRHFTNYKKIQEVGKNGNVAVTIDDDFIVINNHVYDAIDNLSPLDLTPSEINKICLNDYDGKMILFDSKNAYERDYANHRFSKIDCEDSYDKEGMYCVSNDLKSAKVLRETGFIEYHYDSKNNILYFDADKDLKLTEVSGHLYQLDSGYYFSDFDRFSTLLNQVKVWNPTINGYEDLDTNQYTHIYKKHYLYKGNLYGNHSEIVQKDFSKKNARVLVTNSYYYILNEKIIYNSLQDFGQLDLNSLEVLKLPNGEASDYLIGDGFLIYDSELIRNIDTKNIQGLSNEVAKTDKLIIVNGQLFDLKDFPFEIVVIN